MGSPEPDILCTGYPGDFGRPCESESRITFQSTSTACAIMVSNTKPEDTGRWKLLAFGLSGITPQVIYSKRIMTSLVIFQRGVRTQPLLELILRKENTKDKFIKWIWNLYESLCDFDLSLLLDRGKSFRVVHLQHESRSPEWQPRHGDWDHRHQLQLQWQDGRVGGWKEWLGEPRDQVKQNFVLRIYNHIIFYHIWPFVSASYAFGNAKILAA